MLRAAVLMIVLGLALQFGAAISIIRDIQKQEKHYNLIHQINVRNRIIWTGFPINPGRILW